MKNMVEQVKKLTNGVIRCGSLLFRAYANKSKQEQAAFEAETIHSCLEFLELLHMIHHCTPRAPKPILPGEF